MKTIALLAALIIWPDLDDPAVTLHRIFDGPSAVEDCWQYLYHSPHSGYCVGQHVPPRPKARPW